MAKTRKRVLALLMTLVMVMGLLPTSALAWPWGGGGGNEEGSSNNPIVRFYVFDPELAQPTDNSDTEKGHYYPNENNNGGVAGCNAGTGYTGGKLTPEGIQAWRGTDENGISNMKGISSLWYEKPGNLGDFNGKDIIWYSMKQYKDDSGKYYCNIDGYVKGEPINVIYHSNFTPDETDTVSGIYSGDSYTVKTYDATELPDNSGYTFKGWNTRADGGGTSYAENAYIDALKTSLILYAQWDKNPTYTVQYEWAAGSAQPEGVTLPAASAPMEEAALANYTVAQMPTSSDEEITGWYTDAAHTTLYAAGTALKSLAKNGVITLYAYCAPEGDLTIEKTFTAETAADLTKLTATDGGFSITVSGPNDYTTTLTTGTSGVTAGEVETDTGTVSQTYTWTLADLATGQYIVSEDHPSAETDYNVTYDQNQQKTVNLTTAGAEVSFANRYALKKPGVGLTKAVDKTQAKAGETIQYTIGVYNDGTLAANDVIITDVLDGNLTLDTASLPQGVTYNDGTRTITWTVGTVPYGSTAAAPFQTIQLSAQISEDAEEGTKITNQALYGTIASNTVTTEVIDSNLSLAKAVTAVNGTAWTGTGTPVVAPGDTVTFQITVTNTGFAAAEDVEITDILPNEMTLATGTDSDYTPGTVTINEVTYNTYKWTEDVPAATSETDGGGMTTLNPGTATITVVAQVKTDALGSNEYSKTVENVATMNELTAKAEVEISNGEGGLKIMKSLQGSDLSVTDLAGKISFTVKNSSGAEVGTVSLEDALVGKTLDLAPGAYTVYENAQEVADYSLVTTVNSGDYDADTGYSVTVEAGKTAQVSFHNVYTSKIYRVIFDAVATDSAAHDITLGGSVQSYDRYTWRAEGRWAEVSTTQTEANTLELIFTKDQIDAVDGYNVGVQAAPGYAWNKLFVLDSDETVTYSSFAAIVADLASRATKDTGVEYLGSDGTKVTGDVWTICVHAEYDYDLTYTFNDFGSEHVSMAYAVGTNATALTSVSAFGTASAPVEVCAQENLDDPDDFLTVFFFVKAEDGYQLSGQYWETSSATPLDSVTKSDVGELEELPPLEEFPDDALLAAAHAAGYTHYFVYYGNDPAPRMMKAGDGFNADDLNRYFKVVATKNPTYTISGTKTVTLGGNRAPGETTFTFNLEGHRIEANALSLEIGGDVGEIKDTATVTINGSGTATFQFDTIEFTEAGSYVFYVTEVDDSNGSVYWNYDDSEFMVGIYVGEDNNGQLTIDPENGISIAKLSDAEDGTPAYTDVNAIAFTNTYTRRGGGGITPPGGGTTIPDENPPTTDLPDEDVPQTDLPDEDVPQTDLPDEDVPQTDLPDEDVPMAEAPKTGDNMTAWVLAAGVSGIALVWLAISGKKRREDNAQ